MKFSKILEVPFIEPVLIDANRLFVGDICYALDKEIYRDYWGEDLEYRNAVIRVLSRWDVAAIVGHTYWGDGLYYDEHGNKFPVDAGCLGVTNLRYKDKKSTDEFLNDTGLIINVPGGQANVIMSLNDEGEFNINITTSSRTLYDGTIPTK